MARYILENPVRARIACDVREYPFTGSCLYSVDEILDALPWSPSGAGPAKAGHYVGGSA